MKKVTRAEWISAGTAALKAKGDGGLAAEELARALGVTRGSFYHHFANRCDFVEALLLDWESRQTRLIIDTTMSVDPQSERRRRLVALTTGLDHDLEVAVRIWAHRDAQVRKAVARVDRRRIAACRSLAGAGQSVAELLYFTYVGMQMQAIPPKRAKMNQTLKRLAANLLPPG